MTVAPDSGDRARIREALVDLCMEQTIAATTLTMVLERAGVDQAAFERHFEDLEDCFCQVYEEMAQEYMQRVGAAFLVEQGWRNQMRAAAYVTLEYLREDERRARFTFVEVLYAGDRAKLIRDQAMQALFILVDQGRSEMEDPTAVGRYTAETVGSAIYQRIQSAIERNELDAFEAGVGEMMYAVVLPYLGPEAAAEELSIPPPARRPPGRKGE
jgi:AcrR family transcriptional regulator